MTIKSANTSDVLILSTDTVLLNPTTGRADVYAATIHNQTTSEDTVELFISANSASAAGERIDKLVIPGVETESPISLIRSVPSGYYLLAKATTGSRLFASLTYTQYTGAS